MNLQILLRYLTTLAKIVLKEPKLASNTKPDTTACLGAWYTWDRILQTSLEGKALCIQIYHPFSLYFRNLDFFKKLCIILEFIRKEFEQNLVATTIKACFIRIPQVTDQNMTWWLQPLRLSSQIILGYRSKRSEQHLVATTIKP